MNPRPIERITVALDLLGAAGLALVHARQRTHADVKAMLRTYGIGQRPKCQRLVWLENHAALAGRTPHSAARTVAGY